MVVVALALTAFAHRAAPAGAPPAADFLAYVLPDGTLPVLCLTETSDEDGRGDHHKGAAACEFCRIAGSIAVVLPPALSGAPIDAARPDNIRTLVAFVGGDPAFWPAAPPQGPPSRTA